MLVQKEINALLSKIESGEYTITDALAQVAQAQYGEDVRGAIYAGLYTCYHDGKVGAYDPVARAQIAELLKSNSAGLEIQIGATTITYTAGTVASVAVTYEKAFSGVAVPLISSNNLLVELSTNNRTENGFTLNAKSDTSGTAEITWVAIYGNQTALSELTDIRIGADGKTYSTAGEAVRAQLSELDAKFDTLDSTILEGSYFDSNLAVNLLDGVTWVDGYYLNAARPQVNATFSYCNYIDITAYEQIRLNVSRYATWAFYTADGERIADTAAYGDVTSASSVLIDVYPGSTYFRYSCKTEDINKDSVTTIGGNAHMLNRQIANNDGTIIRRNLDTISGHWDTIAGNTAQAIQNIPSVKFDVDISLRAKINSFNGISLSCGGEVFNGATIKIDGDNLIAYRYLQSSSTISTQAHGLTISDVINVIIHIDQYYATVTISTASGMFTSEPFQWYGARTGVTLYNYAGTELTDVDLQWHSSALKEGTWIYGDSYLDNFPIKLIDLGYDKAMFDGFSGRASAAAYASFVNGLKFNNPNTVIWAMGMNDADTNTAISGTWQNYADKVIALCKERNIELIFFTIPNVPTRNNSFKNAYIKASGYKYIDIADCVGASETGSEWYDGLLADDGVHPSEIGRQVIASYIAASMPQLRRVK